MLRDNHLLLAEGAQDHTFVACKPSSEVLGRNARLAETRLGQLDGLGGGVMRPTWPGK